MSQTALDTDRIVRLLLADAVATLAEWASAAVLDTATRMEPDHARVWLAQWVSGRRFRHHYLPGPQALLARCQLGHHVPWRPTCEARHYRRQERSELVVLLHDRSNHRHRELLIPRGVAQRACDSALPCWLRRSRWFRGSEMRIVTFAFVLIAAASGLASAQSSGTDSIPTPAHVDMLTKQLRELLFRDIPLSAIDDSSARAIIRDAVIRRARLDATAPSFHEQAILLVHRRDSLLRRLLTSDEQRRSFAINASSRMLILDEVRTSPPTSGR